MHILEEHTVSYAMRMKLKHKLPVRTVAIFNAVTLCYNGGGKQRNCDLGKIIKVQSISGNW